MSKKRVLAAMSGGVDSSVAAALLLEEGYEVIGVTMQLWDYSQNETTCDPSQKFDTCCSLDDVADARLVAHKLGIPFYVFDYQDDFKENVVDYFTQEYLKGKTPNPCVACNTFLKFDHLLNRAQRLGCDFVATGHYARIKYDESINQYKLLKGLDNAKDQSYFLYSMTQERLSKTLFPVGNLTKNEVRQIAEKYGLVNAQKKESMEICFIPNNDYAKFISDRTKGEGVIKGNIIHEDGQKITSHDGIHQFTVGQRKGLGVSATNPLYVTRIDSESGNVYVGEESYLYREGFSLSRFHQVRPLSEQEKQSGLSVKIRYRSPPCEAQIKEASERVLVEFTQKQKSVTPGQISVFYLGEEVVGGGFIHDTF